MSIESLSNFTEQLFKDRLLIQEIEHELQESNRESSLAVIVTVALKHGYQVSSEEVEMLERFVVEQCAKGGELSGEDLEKVAGGASPLRDSRWIERYRMNYQGIFEARCGLRARCFFRSPSPRPPRWLVISRSTTV